MEGEPCKIFSLWQDAGISFWSPAGGAGFILDAEKYKPWAPPGRTL